MFTLPSLPIPPPSRKDKSSRFLFLCLRRFPPNNLMISCSPTQSLFINLLWNPYRNWLLRSALKRSRIEFESFYENIIKGEEMGKRFVTATATTFFFCASFSGLNVSYALNNNFSSRLIFKSIPMPLFEQRFQRHSQMKCKFACFPFHASCQLSFSYADWMSLHSPASVARANRYLVTGSEKVSFDVNFVVMTTLLGWRRWLKLFILFRSLCQPGSFQKCFELLFVPKLKGKRVIFQQEVNNILWQPPPTARV